MTDFLCPYQKINFQQDYDTDDLYPLDTDWTIIPFKDFLDIQHMALEFYAKHTAKEIEEFNVEAHIRWEEDRKKLEPRQYATYNARGYIYLIGSDHGVYKIGKAKDVSNRYKLIGINLPFPTELLHTIAVSDMTYAERVLHQRYAKERQHGEWFTLSPEQLEEIKAIHELEPSQTHP